MARDLRLLGERNKEIRAAYNKLKCEEQLVSYRGKRVAIRLSYHQILQLLSETYFLSTRRIEDVLSATAPKMAPLILHSEQTTVIVAATL